MEGGQGEFSSIVKMPPAEARYVSKNISHVYPPHQSQYSNVPLIVKLISRDLMSCHWSGEGIEVDSRALMRIAFVPTVSPPIAIHPTRFSPSILQFSRPDRDVAL